MALVAPSLLALFAAGALADADPPASSSSSSAAAAAISLEQAAVILFEADAPAELLPKAQACITHPGERAAQIGCMLDVRFGKDPQAAAAARALFEATGSIAGLLPAQDFDGAYRGKLHLVPELPVGAERKHLVWMKDAFADIDAVMSGAAARAGKDATAMAFRWRDLDVRFFRSVKRKTPSAFAQGWRVSYNLSGSLFTSAARVQETLFHEVFHLNDFSRGGADGWSRRALSPIYDAISLECGVETCLQKTASKARRAALHACLAPYAPDSIKVIGGTYYAFMPSNGVPDYGADIAKRWLVEQRQVLAGKRVDKPFKCGTARNAEAWRLVVDEFFGGVDLVPPCTPP